MKIALFAAAGLLCATPALADPPLAVPVPAPAASPPAVVAPAGPAAPGAVMGTVIDIEITESISTKTCKPEGMFAIRLASPIAVGGKVIIPAGAVGMGQIVDAEPAGALGRPAKLVLAARYLEINGVHT